MFRIRTIVVATVSTAALGLAAPPLAANADGKPDGTCVRQQAQVDKATAALERAAKVFAQQKSHADKGKVAKTRKAKKAQKQRLAKARERLAECQAATPAA